MAEVAGLKADLARLRQRLEYVQQAWSADDARAMLRFYVGILPMVVDAERCSIFIVEPGGERIWSLYGTDLEEHEIEAPKDSSIVGRAISAGKCIVVNDLELQQGFHSKLALNTGFVTRNVVCAPIRSVSEHGFTGAVQVLNKTDQGRFSPADGALLKEVADFLSMAMENILINQQIADISSGIDQDIDKLTASLGGGQDFIASSSAMRQLLETVRMVSQTPVSVFVHGENGTGKEVIARMIHDQSARNQQPFVAVNCASIPETLMESEFFGYVKGAFTGADAPRSGRFEQADGGTLFLDEIADLPLGMQPKFLRAIQEGEGSRLGSNDTVQYDLRIISATNRDLKAMVEAGEFREDLYYRLYAVELHVPPLRERREDILPLARMFLDETCKQFGKTMAGIDSLVLDDFEAAQWPGNVRQLRREIERLVALTPEGEKISREHVSTELVRDTVISNYSDEAMTMPEQVRELEIAMIQRVLLSTQGNKAESARRLGITRQGLHKKLKRYAI